MHTVMYQLYRTHNARARVRASVETSRANTDMFADTVCARADSKNIQKVEAAHAPH